MKMKSEGWEPPPYLCAILVSSWIIRPLDVNNLHLATAAQQAKTRKFGDKFNSDSVIFWGIDIFLMHIHHHIQELKKTCWTLEVL